MHPILLEFMLGSGTLVAQLAYVLGQGAQVYEHCP